MSTYVLQLGQASSEFTLTDQQFAQDLSANLNHGDDVVGLTEVRRRGVVLDAVTKLRGYQLVQSSAGDVALCVQRLHKVIAHGEVASVPARPGAAADGGHGPRPILWVTIQPLGTREHVTVCEGHWPTRRSDTGRQQAQLTGDLADLVADKAAGARLGFWMGDTNSPDRPADHTPVDRQLRKGDLTSCWDELGRWPDTHERATLDLVGSYDPDRRVECLRARVWPRGHSDHGNVTAWYRVRPVRRP